MLRSLDGKGVVSSLALPIVIGIFFFAVVLGVGTGFGLSQLFAKTNTSASDTIQNETQVDETGQKVSAGIKDTKTFPDDAEGLLREGGFEGEGSFHLERPGGVSQNVYLTSSTVDLSEFVGKKVTVLGQTHRASKAGWLMDVGYVELAK